ncbi:MAG: glycosyltransferase family 39 protein [Acidobacteria bacterium]|nr:glycosyltransferase family 39 protein [Acidobacteriota bacterium]
MPTFKPTERRSPMPLWHSVWLLLLWAAIYFAALFSPPLLDDADATHSNAARYMAQTGDLVTLHVNGIRYLEKGPLPYWLSAASFRIFGYNAFASHLPVALAILAFAALAYAWSRRAWNDRAALYAATGVLTSAGVFLFTRTLIPEAILTVLLGASLFAFLHALHHESRLAAYTAWALLALAILAKGLIAPVFVLGTLFFYLSLNGEWKHWRRLRPFSGFLVMFVIAAPWHILAGLRNTGGDHGHGFFWFYFVNEHFLRFLGKRVPHDYNKLPWYLYWTLHIVWLFPWSFFAPSAVIAWRNKNRTTIPGPKDTSARMLFLYGALILVFFAFSTNQEYYTFPSYLPLLMLTAAGIVYAENFYSTHRTSRRALLGAHIALTIAGAAIALALFGGLWSSRHLPFEPDAGSLLAHRGVGDYTLSMSHFFDLTDRSFAALRLPAILAAIAFAFGPGIAWFLRARRKHIASTLTIALTSALFLVAAHIALGRFGTMLSSQNLEAKYESLFAQHAIEPNTELMLYGDQAYGSSIAFYSGKVLPLVEGRSTSLWFGSTFPDAPHIFLTRNDLAARWGNGPRKALFVPLEKRDEVDALLGTKQLILMESSGKALITDRPLDNPR